MTVKVAINGFGRICRNVLRAIVENNRKDVTSVVKDKLVSINFNHNPYSSNFDLSQTQIVNDRLVRVPSWYDNEWGFSCRMSDTAVALTKLL